MNRRTTLPISLGLVILLGTLCAASPAGRQAPNRGGNLYALVIGDPPGLVIHESATVPNVREIRRNLHADATRPMLTRPREHFSRWP